MKENQPDIPKEDFSNSKDEVIENTPVSPWYEKFQELFVDKSETDEDTETRSKRGRFSKLLANIFGKIAPKEEVAPTDEVLEVRIPNQEASLETPITQAADELPVVFDGKQNTEDSYWDEGADEYIEHEQEALSDNTDEAFFENNGLLNVDHDEIVPIEPDPFTELSTGVETRGLEEKSEVVSRQNSANFYESRAYLDYRIAQEARQLSWEAKRTENQLRKELNSAKQKLEKVQPQPLEGLNLQPETQASPKNITPEQKLEPPKKPEAKKTDAEYIETPAKKLTLEKSRNEIPKPTVEVERPAEKLLEKVVEAADHNEAIEKSYELRHEIKDEDLVSGNATSVGEIVASAIKDHSANIADNPLASAKSLRRVTSQSSDLAKGGLYVSAVKGGLYAALAIIVFGVIAYLFVS